MFPWSRPSTPQVDLRAVQAEFDAEAETARRQLIIEVRESEPPFWISLALIIGLAVVMTIGAAALPGGSAGL